MMKVLQKLLLLMAITVGFSLTAMAQRQDDKKPPPKDPNPPKIKVEPKKPDKPREDRKNNDKKRPGMAFVIISNKIEIV
jgi:hypothetical protein